MIKSSNRFNIPKFESLAYRLVLLTGIVITYTEYVFDVQGEQYGLLNDITGSILTEENIVLGNKFAFTFSAW